MQQTNVQQMCDAIMSMWTTVPEDVPAVESEPISVEL